MTYAWLSLLFEFLCLGLSVVFSLVLSASVLYTLVRPTHLWKPIPHGGRG